MGGMAGRPKTRARKEDATSKPARAKGGGAEQGPPALGRVVEYLQRVAAAFAGGPDALLTPEETARLALYHISDPDCTPGLVSAFLRIKLDAERQMHAERLADESRGASVHRIEHGPQEPPPGATDPPELP